MITKKMTFKCRACGKNKHYKNFVNDQGKKLNNCCLTCFNTKVKLHIKYKKVDPRTVHLNCPKCSQPKRLCDMYFSGWETTSKGSKFFRGFGKSMCANCKTLKTNNIKKPYVKKYVYNEARKKRNGKMATAYLRLLEAAKKDGVKCLITRDQFEHLFQKPYDYYDGKRVSFGKCAYRLDRIGLPQFGGDGKKGGDYHIDNVVIAHFKHNRKRELMDLTVADYRKLYRGYMAFRASGKRNPDYLRFKRLKKKLKVKKSI